MVVTPKRTFYRTWIKIIEDGELKTINPFTPYEQILSGISTTPDIALQRMTELHETAVTDYAAETIIQFFISNLNANSKKYQELIAFYNEDFKPFAEYYKKEDSQNVRTPDLESTSSSESSSDATVSRNQTSTRTETPNNYQTEMTHQVEPFDDGGLRNESKDITVESGSNTITESYSGQPDQTTSSASSSSTVTTTGTETNDYSKITYGRDGRRPTSEVVSDGLKAAEMHNILDLIINDIANQIFLQVWII